MGILESKITSKGQTTVPAEVRKMLNLKPNAKIVWISVRPGEVYIVPASEKKKGQSFADSICGIIKDDSTDSLEVLKTYKEEDKGLERLN